MPKRTVTELQHEQDGASKVHASGGGDRPELPTKTAGADEGMGEFEDPWEDEEESDEEIVNGAEEDDPDGMPCLIS
jgi:hypothetical protein